MPGRPPCRCDIIGYDPLDPQRLKHLHFELWDGAWQVGRPIDPLPSLKRWDAIS